MNKHIRVIVFLALILTLGLSACQRSASKAPVQTASATGEIPFPLPTQNALKNLPTNTSPAKAAEPNTPANTQPVAPAVPGATVTLPPLVLPTNTPLPVAPTVAPTFAAVPSATPGMPASYTLHAGEWPYCIARRYNIDANAILTANGLSVNSRPDAGTELKLPTGTGGWTSGSRALIEHPAVYTVKPGDTIYSIACDFGDADPNAIITANHLTEPFDLTSGTNIQVP